MASKSPLLPPSPSGSTSTASNIYAPLPDFLRKDANPSLQEPVVDAMTKKFAPKFIKAAMSKAYDPNQIWQEKLENKTLPLDKLPPSQVQKLKKEERKQRKRKRTLTSREKRELGLYNLAPEHAKWDVFHPIHLLWVQYMEEVLFDSGNRHDVNKTVPGSSQPLAASEPALERRLSPNAALPKLLKADYHGCIITVTRSKNPLLIGTSGIVVKETQETFQLVTRSDTIKIIPKLNSVFTFQLGSYFFEVYGNQFRTRTADRVAKKYKSKVSVDL